MGKFFARPNRDDLIAKRDVYALWKLYVRGNRRFDIRVLKIAVEESENAGGKALMQAVMDSDRVGIYNTPGVVDMLLASPNGWKTYQPLGVPNNLFATPGVL